MANESPVEVYERNDTVVGVPQSAARSPHDGSTLVREVHVRTDRHVLDPNSEDAVQVPEGVGASTAGAVPPLATALVDGTAEQQFEKNSQAEDEVVEPEQTSEGATSEEKQ